MAATVCSYCQFYAQIDTDLPDAALNPTAEHLSSHPVAATAVPYYPTEDDEDDEPWPDEEYEPDAHPLFDFEYNPQSGSGGRNGGGRYGLTVPASNAFTALENAYRQRFGSGFTVNSGFRSYQEQQVAYQKMLRGGPKAATPGTSPHGHGVAVDLGGPIQNTGSAQHAWLRANAAQFGWYWVGQRYGEPWHWEYRPEWNR